MSYWGVVWGYISYMSIFSQWIAMADEYNTDQRIWTLGCIYMANLSAVSSTALCPSLPKSPCCSVLFGCFAFKRSPRPSCSPSIMLLTDSLQRIRGIDREDGVGRGYRNRRILKGRVGFHRTKARYWIPIMILWIITSPCQPPRHI